MSTYTVDIPFFLFGINSAFPEPSWVPIPSDITHMTGKTTQPKVHQHAKRVCCNFWLEGERSESFQHGIMPPPPTGNGPGPGLLDSPIGRFLLPIGGGSAEGAWTLHFHIAGMMSCITTNQLMMVAQKR